MNRTMLKAFSQHTVEGLKSHTLFRLALPPFQSFLDINVDKEVKKDRSIIALASSLVQSKSSPGPDHVSTLLQEARRIDRTFLRKAAVFPIDIQIQYQDIEPYRQQRIELLLQTSYSILTQWQDVSSFRTALSALYTEKQFQQLLYNLLGHYARETKMLSRSVHLPSLFAVARESVTQTISNVMQQEAESLAISIAHKVYHRTR